MTMPIGGISSGDFKETSGRVQLFHVVTRNSVGQLTTDAFTQSNPPVITDVANKSATLVNVTKVGVLGGSVAFTRPDTFNGFHGGPAVTSGPTYNAGIKPLGVFLNDAIGNPFENTPGAASGKGAYVCGSGSCIGVSIYETRVQVGGSGVLSPNWAPGDKVYASVNGLFTNLSTDAYEYRVSGNPAPTVMGIVKVAPDSTNGLLVVDLRV
jgi:hypothetical protein